MGRQRDLELITRDARILTMYRSGVPVHQIAAQVGLGTGGVYLAIKRAADDLVKAELSTMRLVEDEALSDLRLRCYSMLGRTHYTVSQSGVVARHPFTGEPLEDDGFKLQIISQLVRISESKRKLHGIDVPTRKVVEVVTQDMIESKISELEKELERADIEALTAAVRESDRAAALSAGPGAEDSPDQTGEDADSGAPVAGQGPA